MRFRVVKQCKDALTRQVSEAILKIEQISIRELNGGETGLRDL